MSNIGGRYVSSFRAKSRDLLIIGCILEFAYCVHDIDYLVNADCWTSYPGSGFSDFGGT